MKKFLLVMMLAAVSAMAISKNRVGPVSQYGALKANGSKLSGTCQAYSNEAVQVKGMSLFWSSGADSSTAFYTEKAVNLMVKDMGIEVIRFAMGVSNDFDKGRGYATGGKDLQLAYLKNVVNAAIENDIYVIIDWHIESATGYTDQAAEFFEYMATKYGNYPNVIYEVYNEPGTDTWTGPSDWNPIKPYLEFIIPKIRAIDPDNLIIAGTPAYSGNLSAVASDPLTGTNAVNVAYAFHFYASTDDHLNRLLPIAKSALNTIPIFISECGLTNADGNGSLNYNSINQFWQWIDEAKLSWAAWSLSNTAETSAALQTSASTSGNWSKSDLTPSGTWLRNKLREQNPEWTPISGGGGEVPQ